MSPENDNARRDPVDAVMEEFWERSAPILRALLRQHLAAPPRRTPHLAAAPADAGDHAAADEVTRARARALLDRARHPRGKTR